MLRIGCCGFPLGLSRYAREFPVGEVQRTFYRLPKRETVLRWRENVPEDFLFTVKAWQGITHPAKSPTYRRAGLTLREDVLKQLGHFQPTEPVFEGWKAIRETAAVLRAPIVLLQAPPSFRETAGHEENLRGVLSGIDREGIRIALELRSPWERKRLAAVCSEFDLIHCVDPFGEEPVTGPPFYLRLHGAPPGKRRYAYQYTTGDLEWLRGRIAGWAAERDVYCLFNNFSMAKDAMAFRDLFMNPRGSAGSGP